MVGVDGANHLVFLADARSWHRNIRLKFQAPVGMLSLQLKEHLLDITPRFAHGNGRRHPHVEKQVGPLRSTARPPGMAAANSAEVHQSLLAAVRSILFPGR